MNKVKNQKRYLLATFIIIAVALIFCGLSFFTPLRDFMKAMSYRPSDFSLTLASSLDLTDSASLTYRATHPDFIEADFENYCTSNNPDSAVLGCYTGGHIYIYHIEAPELPGITESTTAHELLHAVWERLSGAEQDQLLTALNFVYQDHYDTLKIVDTYPSAGRASELYARVGTEIADLPEVLESHYRKYFNNRAKIVAFYDGYASIFSELSYALQSLETEVASLATRIESETKTYESDSASFIRAVEDFTACSDTPDCFDLATFKARRAELLAEQDRLGKVYEDLSADIDRHNRLVDEYNSNLLRQKTLNSIIKSNKEIPNDLK